MAIHKNFSSNPFEILNPEERWFPADEILREKIVALHTSVLLEFDALLKFYKQKS